jgi:hypothetical protein
MKVSANPPGPPNLSRQSAATRNFTSSRRTRLGAASRRRRRFFTFSSSSQQHRHAAGKWVRRAAGPYLFPIRVDSCPFAVRTSSIKNPKSKIQNPKSKIQNPKSKIQNPKSKIQNPKSKIQNLFCNAPPTSSSLSRPIRSLFRHQLSSWLPV